MMRDIYRDMLTITRPMYHPDARSKKRCIFPTSTAPIHAMNNSSGPTEIRGWKQVARRIDSNTQIPMQWERIVRWKPLSPLATLSGRGMDLSTMLTTGGGISEKVKTQNYAVESVERLTRNGRAKITGAKMKVSASGLCFLVVLVAVSYIGCLLVVSPALLLLPISLSIYRRWTDYFLALWFYLSPVSERNSN